MPVGMVTAQSPEGGGRELRERIPWLALGARLKPGVSRSRASAELAAIGAHLQRSTPSGSVAPPMPGGQERKPEALVWSVERASPIPYGLQVRATELEEMDIGGHPALRRARFAARLRPGEWVPAPA